MDKLGRKQASTGSRKDKEKQTKDEVDRLKQAEKKRRRLEKALATSAAIRSELEMKKLKKMEEQRLDEEGAATAEAVALHVLVGEDADDASQMMLNSFDHSGNLAHFMDYRISAKHFIGEPGRISNAYVSRNKCNGWFNGMSFSSGAHDRDLCTPYEELGLGAGDSAGAIAAHAVSSLCITDSSQNLFSGQNTAAAVINRVLTGHDFDTKYSLFKHY
ncbi:hypothetical protein KSP39_PZI007663 [Platanthera zijinensis]|uniref:Uncharacterized protein n=1 Tax=Platanthera zijinensis TaxID=2320716 RepID=A0AAP0BN28_9ASPA